MLQLTNELIENAIKQLRKQQAKYKVNKNYYEGKHDVTFNYPVNEGRANTKVVVNYFKKFINDEIAYSLGNPITYLSTKDDNELLDLIDLNFSHWSKVHDQELLKEANKFGQSYELQYLDADGNFKATVYNPLNMFVLESGNADKTVLLAIHEYKENMFSDNKMIDVYHANKIYHYKLDGDDTFSKVNESSHIFGNPPIVVCSANTERNSMLTDIKEVNDAINLTLSDYANEVSDFRNALLKITGATLDEEDALEMKRKGIVQVPVGADVDYLIKNLNDTFILNLLNELEDKIYKLGSHIDTNEKLQSNLSGTALRSRMIALENKCVMMQSMLELAIKKRLKNFFKFIKIKSGKEYDYRTLKLKLTLNIPNDLNLMADTVSKLKDIVSQETLLSILPFVESASLELAKFRKEQEYQLQNRISLEGFDDE